MKVSIFIKERERYKLDVAKKQKELPNLTVSPYTASIDHVLLKHMVVLGELYSIEPDETVEQLSSDDVKAFIQPRQETRGGLQSTVRGESPTRSLHANAHRGPYCPLSVPYQLLL